MPEDGAGELQELRARLKEAEDTLDAIRSGAIDALVLPGPDGPKIFTLSGADAVYRIFFQEMAEGALTLNAQGTILFCNQSLSEMLGEPIEKILGASLQRFIVSEDIASFETALEKALKDETRAEITLHTKLTKVIWLSIVAFGPLSSSVVMSAFVVVTDITERKRMEMEHELLQTQKLESLRVMAGGVAHDFNNQLAVILGNLELALDDLPHNSEAKASIINAIRASERSAELSRQMQIYTGSAFYLPVDLDLNELLNKNRDLLKLCVSMHVSLTFQVRGALPHIKGDVDQINRLFMNILINASEAIGDNHGEVQLSTGVVDCDEMYLRYSRLETRPEPGRFVFLEITDSGCGMTPETVSKLFDPFFTTKFTGRGLGMSEALGIVKSHGGALFVVSQMRKGTTIRVLLPVSEKAQAPSVKVIEEGEIKVPAPVPVNRRKTILIVEDEPGVRLLAIRRLDVLGYDTMVAGDGEECVQVFLERHNDIDLVMLDFAMPKMNGIEAFGELIKIEPDVKVILASGYTEDDVLQRFPGKRPAGVLHKPYKMESLKGELERLLGGDS
jgi:PAS domain S-box-containing protein